MSLSQFFFAIIALLLILSSVSSSSLVNSLRICNLADFERVQGATCTAADNSPQIKYTKHPDAPCTVTGSDSICLQGSCSIFDLVPINDQKQSLAASCGPDGYHEVDRYSKLDPQGQEVPGCTVPIKGRVACVCKEEDIQSSFTECINGTRKLVYYFDYDCDSVAKGAAKLPRSQYLPCDLECQHGEYAHPSPSSLCAKVPAGGFSFSGNDFRPPYDEGFPREFVPRCYQYDGSGGVETCGVDKNANSAAGWRPSADKLTLTTGDLKDLHRVDVQFVWHFDIVSLPASLSFEYKMESEQYFDWFGVETKSKSLMWQSGNHPDWKKFEYNFTDEIKLEEICSWSIEGAICIHPNQLAPYDPESFWKPETALSSSTKSKITSRDINLLPIQPGHECSQVAYGAHLGIITKPGFNNNIFIVKEPASLASCSFSQIADLVASSPNGNGVLFVLNETSKVLRGNSGDYKGGIFIGSIHAVSTLSATKEFLNAIFAHGGDQQSNIVPLYWNRYPGHRVELTFFYEKDEDGSFGNDNVHIRNIQVEGTVKAQETFELCEPGHFSTAGSTRCQQCPDNTFCNKYGCSECTSCVSGSVSPRGSTSCTALKNCTENDYSPYRYGCKLSAATNTYQQYLSYELSDPGSCAPIPEVTSKLPSKYIDCNFCEFGDYFDENHGKCKSCDAPDEIASLGFSTTITTAQDRPAGCVKCALPTTVPDVRLQFTELLSFNRTLPSSFNRDCDKCINDVGWDFSVLGDIPGYDNSNFFRDSSSNHQHRDTTVLAVGDRVQSGGVATLSLDFEQEMSGTVDFYYFIRLPVNLAPPSPADAYTHCIDVIVYDLTDAKPLKIEHFNIYPGSSLANRKVALPVLAPGKKRITWIYTNVVKGNNNLPILFGLHSISIQGVRRDSNNKNVGAEVCQKCPFGHRCASSSSSSSSSIIQPCLPGTASAFGQTDCAVCSNDFTNASGPVINFVAPANAMETCRACSKGFMANDAQLYQGRPFPASSFCTLHYSQYILHEGFTTMSAVAAVADWMKPNQKASPNDIPKEQQIVAVADKNFALSYNSRAFIFNLKKMLNTVLVIPPSSHRKFEVTLHGAQPDQVSCLTSYDKRQTNLSFGCATNKVTGETFSIGNHLNLIPIPAMEKNFRVGVLMTISGLLCTDEWGAGSFMRETKIQIRCDPNSNDLTLDDTVDPFSEQNIYPTTSSCNIYVYAKWREACPVCTLRNIGYSKTKCDAKSNTEKTTFFWMDAYRRQAETDVCFGGVALPNPVSTKCPWIHDPIQPSNLEIIAIFICVITLVAIIFFSITYLVRRNSQMKHRFQILQDTVGNQIENRENVEMAEAVRHQRQHSNSSNGNNTNNSNNNPAARARARRERQYREADSSIHGNETNISAVVQMSPIVSSSSSGIAADQHVSSNQQQHRETGLYEENNDPQ